MIIRAPNAKNLPLLTLQKGISGNYVDDARCKPYASLPPNPQPGEIVFPVHRLNLWQRIVRGLE